MPFMVISTCVTPVLLRCLLTWLAVAHPGGHLGFYTDANAGLSLMASMSFRAPFVRLKGQRNGHILVP
ncbi:hypothetical protein E2C01_056765 [Portunus trituberculatus]|uniref:Secreted protein n=1 Tax=Portunus trituberculatus TaxID=210409 RepID=A0A5B7GYL9_PORTR|nr:hypothetical protein [Portunus trituberculatus]